MNQMFVRVLWKEFRTLRVPWIFAALIGLASLPILAVNNSPISLIAARDYVLVGITVASIYVALCAIIAFSGEMEDGTASWLSTLGTNVWPIFLAKVFAILISGLLMLLILFLASWSTYRAIEQDHFRTEVHSGLFWGAAAFGVFMVLESFGWSLLCSLRSKAPLNALIATLVNMGAFAVLVLAVHRSSYEYVDGWTLDVSSKTFHPGGAARTVLLVGLWIASFWSAEPWLVPRESTSLSAWMTWLRWPRISRPMISRDELPTPFQRAWRRLLWLETQSMPLYCGICPVIIALTISALAALQALDFGQLTLVVFHPIMTLLLIPTFGGVLAWRGEQRREQFRFLVNRGVSPTGLWFNKLGMWFSLCIFWSALYCLTLFCSFFMFGPSWKHTTALQFPPDLFTYEWWRCPRAWEHSPALRAFSQPIGVYFISYSLFVLIANIAGIVSVVFATSFALGVYIRNSFISGSLVVVLIMVVLGFTLVMSVPIWVGTALLTCWLCWCGWRQALRWSLDRTNWRAGPTIVAEWTVFPLLFYAGTTAYWVYSVPSPDPVFIMRNLRYVTTPTQDHFFTIASFAREHQQFFDLVDDENWAPIDPKKLEDQWDRFEPELRLLQKNLRDYRQDFIWSLADPQIFREARVLLRLLAAQAIRHLEQNQQEESLEDIKDCFRLAKRLYTGADFKTLAKEEGLMLKGLHPLLVDWAQHPAQDGTLILNWVESLQRNNSGDLERFSSVPRRGSPRMGLTIYREYEKDLAEIRNRQLAQPWTYLPWAAARDRRLAACRFARRIDSTGNESYLGRQFFPHRYSSHWIVGTFEQDPFEEVSYRYLVDYIPGERVQDGLKCTLAALWIVAYQQKHGKYPYSSLPDFRPIEVLLLTPNPGYYPLRTFRDNETEELSITAGIYRFPLPPPRRKQVLPAE